MPGHGLRMPVVMDEVNGMARLIPYEDEEDAVALLEGAGFSPEEPDVFLVEVDVEELPDLALVVANVAREVGESRGEFVESFGHRGRTTVYFRRAIGEATEGRGNFNRNGHLFVAPWR